MPTMMDPPATNEPAGTPSTGTITTLVSGILDDAKTLVSQQIAMVKSEVRQDIRSTLQAAQYGSMGMAALVVGALALITAVANLLHEQLDLQLWVSWGIISLVFLAGGAALLLASQRKFKSFNPLPDKTLRSLKENVTWTRNE